MQVISAANQKRNPAALRFSCHSSVADYRGETKSEDWEQEHIPVSQAISPQLEPFGSLAWDRKAGNHGTDLGGKGLGTVVE